MKYDSRNRLQTNVDVMFLTETSWNEILLFPVRRCQESGSVLCIQGPFIEKTDVGLCFHCMPGLLCEQDNAFSVLSAFRIKVTNGVLSDLWL